MLTFSVQRIDHVVLRVQSLQRAERFYAAVLGCEVVLRRDDLGLVHLRAGASMIDLVSVDGVLGRRGGAAPGPGARNMEHLCLRIEPFDEAAIRAHLQRWGPELGLGAVGPVVDNFGAEGDGPSLYVRDPDGNGIELKGAPRPPAAPGSTATG